MKAKITKQGGYNIYIQGQLHHFPCGCDVEGYVAEKAIEDGAALAETHGKKAPENKADKPPKTKRTTKKREKK